MTRTNAILWSIVLAGAALPAAAQHYAITNRSIAATMSTVGVPVSADQVTPLSDVVSSKPSPAMRVRSVSRLENGELLARLECTASEECLPFFVSVRTSQGGGAQADGGTVSALPVSLTQKQEPRSIVVRAGAKAMLELDGSHVQIRMPVVCLQSGGIGQTIRVMDKSHRQVYQAEVVDDGFVKGRLQ
jgi:hypothetical protein